MNEGLLLARLVLGTLMAAHGSQKLFGWLGGYGLAGTGNFFESLGFRPGRFFAGAAGAGEFVGGLLIALGLLGPIGPAIVLSVMIVAAISVHWGKGLFSTTNGIEVPLLYGAASLALALTGPGRYSLDALFGTSALWNATAVWAAIVVAILAAVANLSIRRAPVAA